VPESPAILFVPKAVGTVEFGNKIINAGNCINPPPPTTASINPAKSEAKAIIIKIEMSCWAKSSSRFINFIQNMDENLFSNILLFYKILNRLKL
jgi:hypothetical protein